jgi:TPR repeat protein
MKKSMAAHYYKLAADQGRTMAQFNYAVLLANGDGTPMNESMAADCFKLADGFF